jgi:hypothetical protein
MPEQQPFQAEVQLLRRGMAIGNRAVVVAIESECPAVTLAPFQVWRDTRPMLDPREHSGMAIDEHAEILSYAEQAGLVQRHSTERHLVRVIHRA